MTSTPARPRRRTTALAAAVATAAALGATALATLGAPAASAAEVPISGYELTWGIKESYRTYVTGAAAGGFTASDGASQAESNGAFTFTGGTGTYDSTTNAVELAFQGSLRIKSDLHRFDLTLSDVKFDSAAAEITADVTKDGATTDDVPLATVTVTREMTDMSTKLTKEAADTFGSASYEGADGDPLTVVQKTTPSPTPSATASSSPTPTPSASASPTQSPSPSASATSSPSPSASASEPAGPPADGEIADGTLVWGVKESFRTYVVGNVANGEITASDGATQAADNGVFTFTDATGTYDTDADTLSAAFEGSVNFKGHEANGTYGLDLTLADVKVSLEDGKGELTADVTSLGEESEDVVLADLTADEADLVAENDVISLSDVTAKLTAEGAEAFDDFYEDGEELDPVDLSVALTDDAELPTDDPTPSTTPSTDPAGSTTGGTGSTTGGTGSTTGGISGGLAATGSDVPVAALGTAAAVAVAAGASVVFTMRRRRAAE
ncbi:HtaA domain-containing protein [Streptomyces blattellae]|uniref:HtaA domain-containing protein n=1 Tax=Streptomyces blattellae TaxID=2569855 RepID=UPI0012B72448|nr:HtaA domain-containing protein [Streptomyces blattellae]